MLGKHLLSRVAVEVRKALRFGIPMIIILKSTVGVLLLNLLVTIWDLHLVHNLPSPCPLNLFHQRSNYNVMMLTESMSKYGLATSVYVFWIITKCDLVLSNSTAENRTCWNNPTSLKPSIGG